MAFLDSGLSDEPSPAERYSAVLLRGSANFTDDLFPRRLRKNR
jgi:hypothetical protein